MPSSAVSRADLWLGRPNQHLFLDCSLVFHTAQEALKGGAGGGGRRLGGSVLEPLPSIQVMIPGGVL